MSILPEERKKKNGFTLIELLIVIAIIGILAGIVAINVTNSGPDARDGRRISDISSIEAALENYFADEKKYPVGGIGADCNGSFCFVDTYNKTEYSCDIV